MNVGNDSERHRGLLPTPGLLPLPLPAKNSQNTLPKPLQGILKTPSSAQEGFDRRILSKPVVLLPLVGKAGKGLLPTPATSSRLSDDELLPTPSRTSSEVTISGPNAGRMRRDTSSNSVSSYVLDDDRSSSSFYSGEPSPKAPKSTELLAKRSTVSVADLFQNLREFSKTLSAVSESLTPQIERQPDLSTLNLQGGTTQGELPSAAPEQIELSVVLSEQTVLAAQSSVESTKQLELAVVLPAASPEMPHQSEGNDAASEKITKIDIRELVREGKLPAKSLRHLNRPDADQGFPGAWEHFEKLINRSWGLTMKNIPHSRLKVNEEHNGLYTLLEYLYRIDAAVYPEINKNSDNQSFSEYRNSQLSFAEKFGTHALTPAMRYHDEARMVLNTVFSLGSCDTYEQMSISLRNLKSWINGHLQLTCSSHDGTYVIWAAGRQQL